MEGIDVTFGTPRVLYVAVDITLKPRKITVPISPRFRFDTEKSRKTIDIECRKANKTDVNYVIMAYNHEEYSRYLNDPDILFQAIVVETMGLRDDVLYGMGTEAREMNKPFIIYTANPDMYKEWQEANYQVLKKPEDLNLLTQTILEHIQKT